MTRHIGAHVSISGGVQNAPLRGAEIGATAIGMFTRNQRQWKVKELSDEEINGFTTNLGVAGIPAEQVLVHSSYLINVANPDSEKRSRAVEALLMEARRVEQLGLALLNFHPGSGLGEIPEDEAISLIARAVAQILDQTATAKLVLETTAGQGAHVGYRFEHLAQIIRKAGESDRIGVCIDSCHIHSAGYDIRTQDGYENTITRFADIVGLPRLAGLHLNDSRSGYASRHDRHESIGSGEIGFTGLARFVEDPRLPDVPIILETPRPELWPEEIARFAALQ